MKVYDLQDGQGRLRAFEIDKASISRGRVVRILESVPGLTVKRLYSWYRKTICDFELGGSTFRASEDAYERSRYLLGPSPDGYSQQIDLVKSAFLRHNTPRWIPTIRVVSASSLGLGALGLVLLLAGPSLPGIDALGFLSGGLVLVGILLMAFNSRRAGSVG
jgi:hypothetical protein